MDHMLRLALGSIVKRGQLQLTTSRGTIVTVGDGTGKLVAVRMTTPRTEREILLNPELRLAEAYMDGTFVVEQGSIADFLQLILSQDIMHKGPRWARPRSKLRQLRRRLHQYNPRRRSRRNVAHHYDLDARLYSLFLDSDRQYSCAYFEQPGATLDDAQLAKKRHLAAKLLLRDTDKRVLDIGCGWGGLALYLAEVTGARLTGITLSREQLEVASERASELGLEERVAFRMQDYRDVAEQYDRIVSVGMFEHVGVGHYDAFFRTCARVLDRDGVMVLHSIGRSEGPSSTNAWIDKYIFPGGYIPSLSEV
ncbi:MAG: class I SAM-dependent methyltransferase, partial [Xanthobacteraceae bacterium]|nr:class I SAM-dependent methyltransferase [Xanthobacteraceae bacterium]